MSIKHNLEQLEKEIIEACQKAGRKREEVRLIAVTKGVAVTKILEAYEWGIRDFGESRLQEALPKIATLPKDIGWHFIGNLQANKAKKIAENFKIIHSLDSFKKAKQIEQLKSRITAFMELNLSKEPQKSGMYPEELDSFMKSITQLTYLEIRGLMAIPPFSSEPEDTRRYFKLLKQIAGKFNNIKYLSMGMSSDFNVAIEEGATHIRIGSRIFKEIV